MEWGLFGEFKPDNGKVRSADSERSWLNGYFFIYIYIYIGLEIGEFRVSGSLLSLKLTVALIYILNNGGMYIPAQTIWGLASVSGSQLGFQGFSAVEKKMRERKRRNCMKSNWIFLVAVDFFRDRRRTGRKWRKYETP